jgi:hypothetical protein
MTTPELSYCAMKKTGNFLPQFKFFEDAKKNFLGNISIECPLKPRKIYLNDIRSMEDPVDSTKVPLNGFGVRLPNGKYRYTFRFGTKADPYAVFVQWILELKIRFNDDNF